VTGPSAGSPAGSAAGPRHRPPFAQPSLLGLVVLGGTAGTAVRYGLESRFGAPAGTWPWATFAINVSGAFVLAALVAGLARSGPDDGWRRRLRLGLGTGLLGGYTTYSTFAVEVDGLLRAGRGGLAVAYALVSVVLGVAAAGLGVWAARRVVPVRGAR
jgi:CrcB protein